MKPCPNCLGEGKLKITAYQDEVDCWECGGFGEVPIEEEFQFPLE